MIHSQDLGIRIIRSYLRSSSPYVIIFWNSEADSQRFPWLARKARQILLLLPNSVDCERAISRYTQEFAK